MRKKVEKAPILSLLFEKEGEENNNENVEMTAPQQRTNHPPSRGAFNALKRNRGRNRSRQKQKKKLPIDHIFQFHDALRVELNRMEAEFLKLPTDGASCSDAKLVREIEGRIRFYKRPLAAPNRKTRLFFHSWRKKKALVNVSHSYTLDHEQESELFEEMLSLIEKLKKHATEREILKEEEDDDKEE